MQNQRQYTSGYGLHPQSYIAPSGHYSQVPNKVVPSQMDNPYGADYYSAHYSIPAQNVVPSSVSPNMLHMHGSQPLYSRVPPVEPSGPSQDSTSPASLLHSNISPSYSSCGNAYSTPVLRPASSSVPSQDFAPVPAHHATPAVSTCAYPNVSYPSMSTGNPYGQVPTSHSIPAFGHSQGANTYSDQSRVITTAHQKVPLGYNSALWSAPELQSTQKHHSGSYAGPLPNASNSMSAGTVMHKGPS